jgi:hypothetical protein
MPWKHTIRRESGLVEHVCKHGLGHPAYASADYMNNSLPEDDSNNPYLVHGCCGCCHSAEWKLADMQQGIKIANSLLKQYQKEIKCLRDQITGRDSSCS